MAAIKAHNPDAAHARKVRAALAATTRDHGPEADVTRAVRDRWRTASWVAAVAAVAAEAPPLDPETREHVRQLLAPVVRTSSRAGAA